MFYSQQTENAHIDFIRAMQYYLECLENEKENLINKKEEIDKIHEFKNLISSDYCLEYYRDCSLLRDVDLKINQIVILLREIK